MLEKYRQIRDITAVLQENVIRPAWWRRDVQRISPNDMATK
jgi:hypothetical protein